MELHIQKIKPTYTSIITTADRFEEDTTKGSIIIGCKGELKQWQTVVAVGSMVRELKVGDKVMININNFAVRKYSKDSVQNDMDNNPIISYKLNFVTMDDKDGNPTDYILMDERDVLYSFEGEEKLTPALVMPKAKKISLN